MPLGERRGVGRRGEEGKGEALYSVGEVWCGKGEIVGCGEGGGSFFFFFGGRVFLSKKKLNCAENSLRKRSKKKKIK